MKIKEEKLFLGKLYKCTSFPSAMGNFFVGYGYDEICICENKIFMQISESVYVELEDMKTNGRKAIKYGIEAKGKGDIFIKDLVPFVSEQESCI